MNEILAIAGDNNVCFTGIQVIVGHGFARTEEAKDNIGHRLLSYCLATPNEADEETLDNGVEVQPLLSCVVLRLLENAVVDGYFHNALCFCNYGCKSTNKKCNYVLYGVKYAKSGRKIILRPPISCGCNSL